MRYWMKQCPKCRDGDLKMDSDRYGGYIACIQCGYIPTDAQEALLLTRLQARRVETAIPEGNKVAA